MQPASAVTVINDGGFLAADLDAVVEHRIAVRVAEEFAIGLDLAWGRFQEIIGSHLGTGLMGSNAGLSRYRQFINVILD